MKRRAGFTLIELSIVLIIIGLIAGGILVGRDLIEAAVIRSQVTQIEKYNAAANTFRLKYGYLPGDIPNDQAQSAGLFNRSGAFGDGDGNGYINGSGDDPGGVSEPTQTGEPHLFWTDLSTAGLIDGSFTQPAIVSDINNVQMPMYLPQAKIGRGYVAVYGMGWPATGLGSSPPQNNYQLVEFDSTVNTGIYALGGITYIDGGGVTPFEAQAIDQKMDDGYPLTGHALAMAGGGAGNASLNISLQYYIRTDPGFRSPFTDCMANTTPITYNTGDSTKANQDICSLQIKAGF